MEQDLDQVKVLLEKVPAFFDSCPLCECRDLRRRWDVNGYAIVRCSGCSLVFVQNRVTVEDLSAYYASVEDEAYDDSNADCLSYYYGKLAGVIRKRFPTPGRILDVGCSRGWFFNALPGWECHGNEISERDAAVARERHGDRIFTGSFEDYPVHDAYFNVITMQDVFDHMREPLSALAKCHRMLKPGGLLVIKVHNISCLYAKVTGRGFYAIIPPSHLFYYDRQTLGVALRRSGFEVVGSRYIGHLLKLKTVFWRLSRGDKQTLAYRAARVLDGSALGELTFHKNLHDIISVFAVKR